MNAPVGGAPPGADQALLIVKSHARFTEKPERTLEALQVFFVRDAERFFAQLRHGPVIVRRGDLPEMRRLGLALRAQGFDVEIRPVGDAPG